MAVSRPVLSLLTFAGLVLLMSPAGAQEPEDKIAPAPPAPFDWQKAFDPKNVPLPDAGGQPITDSDRTWAYVVAVGGFLLVFVMTRVAVRMLAYVLIVVLMLGGVGLLCTLLDERRITTWPMLLLTTAIVAGACGVTSAVVGLFTINQDKD